MSVSGHSRQFRDVGLRPDLPSIADNLGPPRHFALGPRSDIAAPQLEHLAGPASGRCQIVPAATVRRSLIVDSVFISHRYEDIWLDK